MSYFGPMDFRESEYAAWTLVNGYAVNHVTISIHHLTSQIKNIESFNRFIEKNSFKLNSEGGVLKGLNQKLADMQLISVFLSIKVSN